MVSLPQVVPNASMQAQVATTAMTSPVPGQSLKTQESFGQAPSVLGRRTSTSPGTTGAVEMRKERSKSMAMIKYQSGSVSGNLQRGRSIERSNSGQPRGKVAASAEKYKHGALAAGGKVIKERIDEEEDYPDDEPGAATDDDALLDAARKGGAQAAPKKRNFLLKSILDQTKELCFEHASLYKDFESVYSKILMRF